MRGVIPVTPRLFAPMLDHPAKKFGSRPGQIQKRLGGALTYTSMGTPSGQ